MLDKTKETDTFWNNVNLEGGKFYNFFLGEEEYYCTPSAAKQLCGGEIRFKMPLGTH